MKPIPEELLDRRVWRAIEIGGAKHVTGRDITFSRGDGDEERPTLRDLLTEGKGPWTLPEGAWNLVMTLGDQETEVVWITDRWNRWYLGKWDRGGMTEARRCGLLSGIPVPLYAVGQEPWLASAVRGTREVECPDCHDGRWNVKSPKSELTVFVKCPRCDGKGKLGEVAWLPEVKRVRIGAVKTNTGARPGRMVEYSSNSDGHGNIWYEEQLFDLPEYAMELAKVKAEMLNAEEEKRSDRRAMERELWVTSWDQAELKKMHQKVIKAEGDRDSMRRRVVELLDEIGGTLWVTEEMRDKMELDYSGPVLSEAMRRRVIAWIFDTDEEERKWLAEALAERDECSC